MINQKYFEIFNNFAQDNQHNVSLGTNTSGIDFIINEMILNVGADEWILKTDADCVRCIDKLDELYG